MNLWVNTNCETINGTFTVFIQQNLFNSQFIQILFEINKVYTDIINIMGEFKIQTRLGFGWDSRPNVKILRSQCIFFNQVISYDRMFIRKCLFVLVILIWLEISKFCVHSVAALTSVKLDTTLDCRLRKPNQSSADVCLFYAANSYLFSCYMHPEKFFVFW
jgi:hypothetical protein